ncbi:glycoside hydrolase family 26 protein [Maribacter sp. HTCC2170]|uniref:glycoside hydrolase family 26 protein n=1 Tax=Maribacter sp. (strain HTCC2170 / KCCM 42371) TaxID=313603 RepID=UPI00006B4774|nr:glycosyl hydrolase [Maribacter sp. HTCC2170]
MLRVLYKYALIIVLGTTFISCKTALLKQAKSIELADKQADISSRYLMQRIRAIPNSGYAFGHQDATAYGMGWKNEGDIYKSDVHEVVGDHPAIYGFELGHLELGHSHNLDTVNFDLMRKLIKKAHNDGGIITISWHPDNPVTKKSAWDPSPAVSQVLEGGLLSPKYRAWLTRIAGFIKSLKTKSGKSIPVVFRPYHEMNGSWFWWGQGNCTPKDFKLLWRETFEFFTNTHNVHNLLYCYSSDAVKSEKEYLDFYPGDDYVDILGMDLYHKNGTSEYIEILNTNLDLLGKLGKQKK